MGSAGWAPTHTRRHERNHRSGRRCTSGGRCDAILPTYRALGRIVVHCRRGDGPRRWVSHARELHEGAVHGRSGYWGLRRWYAARRTYEVRAAATEATDERAPAGSNGCCDALVPPRGGAECGTAQMRFLSTKRERGRPRRQRSDDVCDALAHRTSSPRRDPAPRPSALCPARERIGVWRTPRRSAPPGFIIVDLWVIVSERRSATSPRTAQRRGIGAGSRRAAQRITRVFHVERRRRRSFHSPTAAKTGFAHTISPTR